MHDCKVVTTIRQLYSNTTIVFNLRLVQAKIVAHCGALFSRVPSTGLSRASILRAGGGRLQNLHMSCGVTEVARMNVQSFHRGKQKKKQKIACSLRYHSVMI